jgi:hypothetical protein
MRERTALKKRWHHYERVRWCFFQGVAKGTKMVLNRLMVFTQCHGCDAVVRHVF